MQNAFNKMAENIANVYKEIEQNKVQKASNEVLEMLVNYDFIHDCFTSDEELQSLILTKIQNILFNNLI